MLLKPSYIMILLIFDRITSFCNLLIKNLLSSVLVLYNLLLSLYWEEYMWYLTLILILIWCKRWGFTVTIFLVSLSNFITYLKFCKIAFFFLFHFTFIRPMTPPFLVHQITCFSIKDRVRTTTEKEREEEESAGIGNGASDPFSPTNKGREESLS